MHHCLAMHLKSIKMYINIEHCYNKDCKNIKILKFVKNDIKRWKIKLL